MSLEDQLAALKAAVETLTGVIAAAGGLPAAAGAAAPAASAAPAPAKPGRPPKAATAPVAQPGSDPFADPPAGAITQADIDALIKDKLRNLAIEKLGEGPGVERCKALIQKFGSSLSAVPPQKWPELKAAAEALVAELSKAPVDDL